MMRKTRAVFIGLGILLTTIFSLPLNAFSDSQVTLNWDPNAPTPAGYRLYGREEGYNYNYDEPWWEGDSTFTQCTIDQLDENTTYYFVVRAYDASDNESSDSNEVVYNSADSESGGSLPGDSTGLSDPTTGSSGGGGGGGGCFLDTLAGR